MVFWQPVVYFRELDNGEKAYYCHEVFRDPDNAKAHGYDVADKMAEDMDRQVVTKRVILDDSAEK